MFVILSIERIFVWFVVEGLCMKKYREWCGDVLIFGIFLNDNLKFLDCNVRYWNK